MIDLVFFEGDKLLTHIGKKLKERANKYGIVAARLTADMFTFLDEEENMNPEAFGAEVQEWVRDYPLGVDIKIDVGIYHIESQNIPVRLMCDRANFAINTVKGNYMINVAEYNKSVRDYAFSQQELLNDEKSAFENREFKVYLQPKYDIRANKIIGAESLVRWEHPERGLIFPRDFIPLFEQNMLITRLDEYVWEETCRMIKSWIDKGYKAVPVSVNVSRLDILSLEVPEKFVEFTDKNNIDRKYIEIEITESAFTNDEEQIIKVLDELRSLGFKVLMDDFGSGYSSLNILKDINVDVLKIDTRFLESEKSNNKKGKEILEAVIKMAKWIGLKTIAEGVETDEQKRFLMNLGCYYAQGFYFSKPLPQEEFEEIIKNPDNVITERRGENPDNKIVMEDLFHSDFMTESLINNILGGVAIYGYDRDNNHLKLLKVNDAYCEIFLNYHLIPDVSLNLLETVYPEDREKVTKAFDVARENGSKGAMVHLRSTEGRWITLKMYFLADREKYEMYYASVSDYTEHMNVINELDMSRKSFETALQLIEAVVLEYNFADKTMYVTSEMSKDRAYIFGDKIENAIEEFVNRNVIHSGSIDVYKEMCEHLKASDKPISRIIDLLYEGNVYMRCEVTAKTVFSESTPLKSIIVIKSTGKTVR